MPVALETEACFQFIGHELKVGRFLQRDKILQELAGCWRPIWPVTTPGEPGAERRAVLQPAGAQPVKVRLADLEVLGGFGAVD